jgi:hypothetical protein
VLGRPPGENACKVLAQLGHTDLDHRLYHLSWVPDVKDCFDFENLMTRPEILKMRSLPSILRILLYRSSAILFKVQEQSRYLTLVTNSWDSTTTQGFSQTLHATRSGSRPFG